MIGLVPAVTNHVQPLEWLWVVGVLALLAGVAGTMLVRGRSEHRDPVRASLDRWIFSLEGATGLPAWAAAGLAIGSWALLTAMLGFFWDVAWHIDLGRDRELLTPPHILILMGLMALPAAAASSIVIASYQRVQTGWRIGPIHVPYSSLALLVLGGGALMGFPLDDLWHRTYGVDVTMWSPTHMLMICGAVFSSFAFALMFAEGGGLTRDLKVWGRDMKRLTGIASLASLTALGLEFDYGVPQFQQLYHPLLLMLAAGLGLTIARLVLGRGGAIRAATAFVLVRTVLALLISGLGLEPLHFPLYIVAAICVERAAKWNLNRSPLAFALTSGALIGTVGLAAEWGWTQLVGRQPWNAALFPGIWIAVVAALAAAIVGTAAGHVLVGKRANIPGKVVALAGAACIGALLLPLPRTVTAVQAEITTAPIPGTAHPTVDNNDLPSVMQQVNMAVTLTPPDAARGADWFRILSWQGGGWKSTNLMETTPGHFVSAGPVPVGGSWKTLIRLARHAVMMAVPVFMPADPVIGAPEVPLQPDRTASFVSEGQVLMREAHGGAAWVAALAYSGFGAALLVWGTALVVGYLGVGHASGAIPPRTPRSRQRAARLAFS